ncbi:MAG TPA: nucleoside-diphosphate kinase [Thermoproteota archaeon]|nr:nucleoside-diphosphate kinase [Thermoproteota archaeon]
MQRGLVLLKPDATLRGHIGDIVSRFEKKGLKIIALKMMSPDKAKLERLYSMHKGKAFYQELIDFMSSGPLVAIVVKGPNAVSVVRLMLGATKFTEAAPGTIRGDYAMSTGKNLVHASDSAERAEEEISILFKEDEMVDWDQPLSDYLY